MVTHVGIIVHVHPVEDCIDVLAIFPAADKVHYISDLRERIPERVETCLRERALGGHYRVGPIVLRPEISRARREELVGLASCVSSSVSNRASS
jgi:hypothetical protein